MKNKLCKTAHRSHAESSTYIMAERNGFIQKTIAAVTTGKRTDQLRARGKKHCHALTGCRICIDIYHIMHHLS